MISYYDAASWLLKTEMKSCINVYMGSLSGNYFIQNNCLCKRSTQIYTNTASLPLAKQILVPSCSIKKTIIDCIPVIRVELKVVFPARSVKNSFWGNKRNKEIEIDKMFFSFFVLKLIMFILNQN